MEAINNGSLQIALAVDGERKLVGVVTDGDVRRALLRGAAMDDPIDLVLQRNPLTASVGVDRRQALEMMLKRGIKHLPLVDDSDRLIDLILLTDLVERPTDRAFDAVVMAGGLGTRLRPLTHDVPKPMLRVGDKPILEIIVERLARWGARSVFISTNYLGDTIEDHFQDGSRFGVPISYIKERDQLGTIGSLTLLDQPLSAPFLLLNGDILTNCNFQKMVLDHVDADAAVTVGVSKYELQVPYGVLDIANDDVTSLSEKPVMDFFINAGIYAIDPSVVELIPKNCLFHATDMLKVALDAGQKVHAFPIGEYWLDVGRPEDYARAEEDVRNGSFS